MCRALRVLCAAPDEGRLLALRRATTAASWEVVGGATSIDDLARQVVDWRPDVVVVDAAFGDGAVPAIRSARPTAKIVAVGSLAGADAEAVELDEIRPAIVGLPRPGGPVRA